MARRSARLLALLWLAAPAAATAQDLRVAHVPVSGRAGLDSLARLGFEVASIRVIDGRPHAVIVVSDRTAPLVTRAGLALLAPPEPPSLRIADTFRVYRSFDKPLVGIRATLEAWAGADTIFHLDSIGASLEGRPLLAVKIGDQADSPSRPNVLFMATHHAREWVATEVGMKLARWIADSLPRALLAQRDIWVIPVQNPDGYQFTFTGDRLWRKNRRLNGDGTYGVDMNRNYPGFWGIDEAGSSGQPLSEVYRGPSAASEPETQAIIAFHAAHPPVVAASYHTYSGLVLYPYGYRTGQLAPDRTLFQTLAGTDLAPAVLDHLPTSNLTYYHPGPGWNLYPTNGEYTDWAYLTHGTIAFTPELTSGCCTADSGYFYDFRFPDDSGMVEQVFRDNLPFAVSLIGAAGDLRNAVGVSGLRPAAARFESLWPESWLVLDAATPQPLGLSARMGNGSLVLRGAQTDSLRRGVIRSVWRTDVLLDTVRALRADGLGVQAELITLAGAEDTDHGWTGWQRSADPLTGYLQLVHRHVRYPYLADHQSGGARPGVAPCVDQTFRHHLRAGASRHHPVLGRQRGVVERRARDCRRRITVAPAPRGPARGVGGARRGGAVHRTGFCLVGGCGGLCRRLDARVSGRGGRRRARGVGESGARHAGGVRVAGGQRGGPRWRVLLPGRAAPRRQRSAAQQ